MSSLNNLAAISRASQDAKEMGWMLNDVATINPKVIVEIGCDQGWSLQTYQEAFQPEVLIGIQYPREPNIERLCHTTLRARMIYFDSHEARTREYLEGFLEGRKIDFLFIDGDHSYDGVKMDFKMYKPLVRKGGIIGLHDTRRVGPEWQGKVEVARLFKELSQKYKSHEHWNAEAKDAPGTGLIFV